MFFPETSRLFFREEIYAMASIIGGLLYVGILTQTDAVEEDLKLLVQRKKQENIKDLRGKLHCKGAASVYNINS